MSRAASNYNIPALHLATGLALIGTILSAGASLQTLKNDLKSSTLFLTMTILYAIMMFASSYVEEEHNYWYWATSIYLSLLALKTLPRSITTTMGIVVTLLLVRTVRRWNQTGQKFAGAPDISHHFLSNHASLLWALILATYLWNCFSLALTGFPHMPRQFAKAGSQVLMLLGITFKLAFTHEDAPELLDWVAQKVHEKIFDYSLVQRARALYLCIGLALVYAVVSEVMAKTRRHRVGKSSTTFLSPFPSPSPMLTPPQHRSAQSTTS